MGSWCTLDVLIHHKMPWHPPERWGNNLGTGWSNFSSSVEMGQLWLAARLTFSVVNTRENKGAEWSGDVRVSDIVKIVLGCCCWPRDQYEWAQPVRDDVTRQCRLPLAEPIPGIIFGLLAPAHCRNCRNRVHLVFCPSLNFSSFEMRTHYYCFTYIIQWARKKKDFQLFVKYLEWQL